MSPLADRFWPLRKYRETWQCGSLSAPDTKSSDPAGPRAARSANVLCASLLPGLPGARRNVPIHPCGAHLDRTGWLTGCLRQFFQATTNCFPAPALALWRKIGERLRFVGKFTFGDKGDRISEKEPSITFAQRTNDIRGSLQPDHLQHSVTLGNLGFDRFLRRRK